MDRLRTKPLRRQQDSVVLHFDYDCFYAAVFERETPLLRSLPLAVQQKQIVVTCNYAARRRGLYKLQLITDAKKTCPDVIIVNGEDLTRFRDASKELSRFLGAFSWNARCERLGFDEVFMDVSDIIDWNLRLLNPNHLTHAFFHLSRDDPAAGFLFDASHAAGHVYPQTLNAVAPEAPLDSLRLRLHLASHLAKHLREQLESEKGYTCTVGISTNKLLAKLVGNLHKPNGQTSLMPPYASDDDSEDNVSTFVDGHEVGKIPGIGFKIAQKLRAHMLQRPAEFDAGLVYGGTKDCVLVGDVRSHVAMGPGTLERILGGPGVPHGIGVKIWGLLNGCDDSKVGEARDVPKQISIEDSYLRLDTLDAVVRELLVIAKSLLKRMHIDLLEQVEAEPDVIKSNAEHLSRRWLAYPRTLRLSTRPRPPRNLDGSRNRSFARISRSAPMPSFIFNLKAGVDALAERLVAETLVPLFRKLHPDKSGWNLSLINVAATNLAGAASDKGGLGRDISKMFKRRDDVLREWKVEDIDDHVREEMDADPGVAYRQMAAGVAASLHPISRGGSEDVPTPSQESNSRHGVIWDSNDEDMMDDSSYRCDLCHARMPLFAMPAHDRWHSRIQE